MWLIDLSTTVLEALVIGYHYLIDFLTSTLAEILEVAADIPFIDNVVQWLLTLVDVAYPDGTVVSLGDLTILELIFGIGLPVFFSIVIVKWILDIVT